MVIKSLEDLGIKYIAKSSRSPNQAKSNKKRIIMSFRSNGTLSIRYTTGTNISDLNTFIDNHLDWITKTLQSKTTPVRQFLPGETYLYLGKIYQIEVHQSNYPEVILKDNRMIIYSKRKEPDFLLKVLDEWKTKMAEIIFNEVLMQIFNKMANYLLKYPTLQIKDYKARWGCCYHKRNLIILNRSLIHVPLPLIEYVIYHELVHLIIPNHGAKFHQLLKQFIPQERLMKKELAKYLPNYQ